MQTMTENHRHLIDRIPKLGFALRLRHAKFVDAYLANGGNGTKAAIEAGYSEKSAHAAAHRLLRTVTIHDCILEKRRVAALASGLTIERVQAELARVAFADPRNLVDDKGMLKRLDQMDADTAATVSSIENEELFDGVGKEREHIGTLRKVKTWDKVKALQLAGQHLGMFVEKVDVRVGIGILVIHE